MIKRWSDLHIVLFEQRLLLGLITLAAVSVTAFDRITIYRLETQLREKEYILAPGLTDFARVRPGVISSEYVKEFSESLASSLGNFSAREVEERYRTLEKYLANDFRIQFREDTTKQLKLLASNDVAEMFVPQHTEVKEQENGFIASVFGQHIRYVAGLKVFEGRHVILFTLKGVAPQANRPWALEVQNIARQTEELYEQQRSHK